MTSGDQRLARVLPAPSTLSSTDPPERGGGEHLPRCPLGVSLGSRMTAARGLGSFFQTHISLLPASGTNIPKFSVTDTFAFLLNGLPSFLPAPASATAPHPLCGPFIGSAPP